MRLWLSFLPLLLLPLASCGTVAKHCDPAQSPTVTLQVRGEEPNQVARLLVGQALQFSDAPDWSFTVSEPRVLKEDDCPGRPTSFRALQPGSSMIEALWSPGCLQAHPACAMPSRIVRVTVIVDGQMPLLPALTRNGYQAETIGLLAVGEKVEVAMPPDLQYHAWQNISISDSGVLRPIDMSAGIGLVVLQAAAPGLADLTADAKPASWQAGGGGFFRIEFVVRPVLPIADVTVSDSDSGRRVSMSVGQILAFSLPSGFPAGWPERYGLAGRSGSVFVPLDRPSIDAQDRTRYLLARAAGTQNLWWSSCPPTQPLSATCQPEVGVNVVAPGDVAVEATDTDRNAQFTLHPGQEIVVTLHPYIGPWRGIAHAGGVVELLSNQTINGIQVWTFRAVSPGRVGLDASYGCPAGEVCPPDPLITVQIIAS